MVRSRYPLTRRSSSVTGAAKRRQSATKSPTPVERRPRRPRPKPVSIVDDRFAGALRHLGAALLETSHISNTGIKGGKREEALRKFLQERLPKRYGVATGAAVDQLNVSGPQLDVLIFDQMRDFSLSDGEVQILPAEALLASIEVKSKLTSEEVRRSSAAARQLRSLRPFRRPLWGRNMGGAVGNDRERVRYLHCVFAFGTDIAESNWVESEASRFLAQEEADEHLIDAVYVFDRGLLNLTGGTGRREDDVASAITTFYFTLLNFIDREGRRRAPTPYPDYASNLAGRDWITFREPAATE